jgi:virginiamycin B lyase
MTTLQLPAVSVEVMFTNPFTTLTDQVFNLPTADGVDICAGPDGNLWVADGLGYVWVVTVLGVGTRHGLPGGAASQPTGICTGPDNNIWTCGLNATVWQTIPPGTTSTAYTLTGATCLGVCAGPDGNLWVADQTGYVWKVTTGGVGTQYALAGSNPTSICAGPDGNIWVTDTNAAVWKVTPAGSGTKYTLTAAVPQGICTGPNGHLWITDSTGYVWKVNTSGVSVQYATTGGYPNGICVGSDGNLWASDANGAAWSITTSGTTTQYPLAGAPSAICAGPDNNVWLSDTTHQVWSVAPPAWTDISSSVISFTTSGGRQHELDRMEASTAQITLDNRDGDFSPYNTSSQYYAAGLGLVPMRPVRIQATWNSITYPVFYGYADLWKPTLSQDDPLQAECELQATDAIKFLSNTYLSNSTLYPNLVQADGAIEIWRMGDPVGSSTAAPTFHPSWTAVAANGLYANAAGPTFGAAGPILYDPTTAVQLQAGASVGTIFFPAAPTAQLNASSSWSVDFWIDNVSRTYRGGLVPVAVYSNQGTGAAINVGFGTTPGDGNTVGYWNNSGPTYSVLSTATIADGKPHYIALTGTHSGSNTNVRLYVDGVSQGVAVVANTDTPAPWSGGPSFEFVSGTDSSGSLLLSNLATYTVALSGAQVTNHYTAGMHLQINAYTGERISTALSTICGFPSSLTNLSQGLTIVAAETTTVVSRSALDYCTTISDSEPGTLFQDPTGIVTFLDRRYQLGSDPAPIRILLSQGTFGDNENVAYNYMPATLVIAQDDLDLWNIVPVAGDSGAIQTATNVTSVDAYGQRTLQGRTSLSMASNSDALLQAEMLLAQFENPLVRAQSVQMSSATNGGACLPQMLGRAFFDRVTLQHQDYIGGSQFVQDSVVEHVDHHFNADPGEWLTVWMLSPYEVIIDPLRLTGSILCTTSASVTTVTTPANFGSYLPGMSITGTNIPPNTTVTAVVNGTTFDISNPATGGGAHTLTFTSSTVLSGPNGLGPGALIY